MQKKAMKKMKAWPLDRKLNGLSTGLMVSINILFSNKRKSILEIHFIIPCLDTNEQISALFLEGSDPLPSSQSKACLNWDVVNREINWSVPFILGNH